MRVAEMPRWLARHSGLAFTLVVALCECLGVMLIYQHADRGFMGYDTASYIMAGDHWLSGHIDSVRTPVYPLLLKLTGATLDSTASLWAIVLLQLAVFLLSIVFFRRLARRVWDNDAAVFVAGLAYATVPTITLWTAIALTESLTLSVVVFLLYALVRAVDGRSVGQAVLTGAWLVMLVMLRPAMAYLVVAVAMVWVLLLFKSRDLRRVAVAGLAAALTTVLVTVGYMCWFKHTYGLFTMSEVGTCNLYHTLRINNEMDTALIADRPLRAEVSQCIQTTVVDDEQFDIQDLFIEYFYLSEEFGFVRLNTACQAVVANDPWCLPRCWWRHCKEAWQEPLVAVQSYEPWTVRHREAISRWVPCAGWLYAFVLVFAVVLVCRIIKRHRVPWLATLLTLITLGNMAAVIIGAQDDWSRLMVPSMPVVILMAAIACREIFNHHFRRIES